MSKAAEQYSPKLVAPGADTQPYIPYSSKVLGARRTNTRSVNVAPYLFARRSQWFQRLYAAFVYFGKVYKFNKWLLHPQPKWRKGQLVLQTTRKVIVARKRLLFYPERPGVGYVMYKICLVLGYRPTTDVERAFNLAMKWSSKTLSPRDRVLTKLVDGHEILNIRCENIRKTHVDSVFRDVFGCSTMIDPLRFEGKCVEKSNLDGLHDGTIVNCPVQTIKDGFVYQRVINNERNRGMVEDIRVPIFKDTIPFVYLKYRPVDKRFAKRNTRVLFAEPLDVFSQQEIRSIVSFCGKMGLDYGELDVLRDGEDGKIYIIDVNNIPGGTPNDMREEDEKIAFMRLAETFENVFITANATN